MTDSVMPPVLPVGGADYGAIFARHNLCTLAAGGTDRRGVDMGRQRRWCEQRSHVGMDHLWEPIGTALHSDCGKVLTTLTYNYLREVDVALESYNHRLGRLLHPRLSL